MTRACWMTAPIRHITAVRPALGLTCVLILPVATHVHAAKTLELKNTSAAERVKCSVVTEEQLSSV